MANAFAVDNLKNQFKCVFEKLMNVRTNELDYHCMKNLKELCKCSNDNVIICFNFLMMYLSNKEAQLRYLAFLVIKQLYIRSQIFRVKCHENLYELFAYTVETEPKLFPVCTPTKISRHLKLVALETFNEWFTKYGDHYRKLNLGYRYLKDICQIDFDQVQRLLLAIEEKKQMKLQVKESIRQEKLQKTYILINKSYNDIIYNIKGINNCFDLLIPKAHTIFNDDIFDNPSDNSTSLNIQSLTDGFVGSDVGFSGQNFSVNIAIEQKHEITETIGNKDLIINMTDIYKELKKQIPNVENWINNLKECSSCDKHEVDKVLGLHGQLIGVVEKYEELIILDEDNDNFVDVPESLN